MAVLNRIKDLREDNDLTQKQLADKLNMHVTQYRRYEKGESPIPVDFVITLAKMYNVSLDYLCGLEQKKRPLFINSEQERKSGNTKTG